MVYFYGENSKWYEENASTLFHNNYSYNNSFFPKQFITIKYRTWEIYVYKRVSFSKSLVCEWTQSSPDSMSIHCHNTALRFAGYSYRVYQAIFIMVKTLKKISVWLKIRRLFICKWNIVLYMKFICMYALERHTSTGLEQPTALVSSNWLTKHAHLFWVKVVN